MRRLTFAVPVGSETQRSNESVVKHIRIRLIYPLLEAFMKRNLLQ